MKTDAAEYAPVATEACDPNLFYSENRLHDDGCFKQDRDRQSAGVGAYLTEGLVPQGQCGADVARIAACHPNLRFRNGVGMASPCAIDDDSKARYGALQTNPKHRQQLQPRVYTGHPHYERGCLAPDTESGLIHTQTTRTSRPCGVLSGVSIDRFVPLVACLGSSVQDPEFIVNDRVGSNTRAWVRDEDYIRNCGFTHDGASWRRA
jgi:hypothetical protein